MALGGSPASAACLLTAVVTGIIFGIGLILSGVTNPTKVSKFLDLANRWDPSLGLVMDPAILVGVVAPRREAERQQSLTDSVMRMPAASNIDRGLVLYGLTVGADWGLAGYFPRPALASLATGGAGPRIFVAAMVEG